MKGVAGALKIDVVVEAELWRPSRNLNTLVRRAIAAAAATLSTPGAELAVVLTDDAAIRLLNRRWRGIDAATNVLSFSSGKVAGNPPLLGDVVLAYETVAQEAADQRKPFADHVAHLVVHGFLHLLGYDHESDRDAKAMERAERDILDRLSIPDPYLPRARARNKAANKRRRVPTRKAS